jgi:iron complex outermembrane receptor protein
MDFGSNYEIGKFGFLEQYLFGKTTFKQDGLNSNLRTEFTQKLLLT